MTYKGISEYSMEDMEKYASRQIAFDPYIPRRGLLADAGISVISPDFYP